MRGTVKWFSRDNGYGFITGDDGQDRYFAVQQIDGSELPQIGHSVEFEHQASPKGARAAKVKLMGKSPSDTYTNETSQRADGRVKCKHCQALMIPRMTFYKGAPSKSFCVHCGRMHKSFEDQSQRTAILIVILVALIYVVLSNGFK